MITSSQALDRYWHEDCLKCGCCGCRLGEVGSTLYTRANLILCKRDYLRLFGTSGSCAACTKVIPAFEMVMRAKTNVYHLECFACQQCHQRYCLYYKTPASILIIQLTPGCYSNNMASAPISMCLLSFLFLSKRFCVGDRFYLCDNQILCEYDYEERLVFANLASQEQFNRPANPPPPSSSSSANNSSTSCSASVRIRFFRPFFLLEFLLLWNWVGGREKVRITPLALERI